MTFDGISSKNHKNPGEVRLLGFLYTSKVIFKLSKIENSTASTFLSWKGSYQHLLCICKMKHDRQSCQIESCDGQTVRCRAVNWDSRVQTGLTSPSPLQRTHGLMSPQCKVLTKMRQSINTQVPASPSKAGLLPALLYSICLGLEIQEKIHRIIFPIRLSCFTLQMQSKLVIYYKRNGYNRLKCLRRTQVLHS